LCNEEPRVVNDKGLIVQSTYMKIHFTDFVYKILDNKDILNLPYQISSVMV
jgi:hypothetical protein